MNTPTQNAQITSGDNLRTEVKKTYGSFALNVVQSGGTCCATEKYDPITSNLYSEIEQGELPEAAVLASLGCGNPTALAQLNEGEIVLDLGSGGGIDVLLSARRVGLTGFAYGLDMTDEMLQLAETNKEAAGATNVKFLKGHIESIPLPDETVNVIISNCVINLSADKDQVLREAFRVLHPGGRFAVSDVVVEGEIPDALRADMEAYVGCVAGALEVEDYKARLAKAGFEDISIEPTRRYRFSDLEGGCCSSGAMEDLSTEDREDLDGKIMGAFIRATKPR